MSDKPVVGNITFGRSAGLDDYPTHSPELLVMNDARYISDDALLGELRRRGYRAFKEQRCGLMNFMHACPAYEYEALKDVPEWVNHVEDKLASDLGRFLRSANAIEFTRPPRSHDQAFIKATAMVVGPLDWDWRKYGN